MQKGVLLVLLILMLVLVSGCVEVGRKDKKGIVVVDDIFISHIKPKEQEQKIYAVDYVINYSSLFLDKDVCIYGMVRSNQDVLYVIDENQRRWIMDVLERKRIKLSSNKLVEEAKYLICGKFYENDGFQIDVSSFLLGGPNRTTNITEEISKLCYYFVPNAGIGFGDYGMNWGALPLRKPHPCKNDEDCILLGPSYKNWTIDEVKCNLDNSRACITDEDCVLGGTCHYQKGCYNKDYWVDYFEYNCKHVDWNWDELFEDPMNPYFGCKCYNNYCTEKEYQCPELESIDCMPAIPNERIKYCEGHYHEWMEENCNISFSW